MTLRTVRIPKWDVRLPVHGLMAVVGATLLLVSLSVEYSYGNLNTYVMSYLRSKNSKYTYADWIFVSQGKVLLSAALAPVGGIVSSKLGLKMSIIIGSTIASGGYLLTYFALDAGLWPCVFSIAVSGGVGFGLAYPPALAAVLKWFPESQRGFFCSIAIGGYGFGSALWTPLETAYANPDNIGVEPVEGDDEMYFVDEDVLNRIPKMFLLLGGCFLVLQIPAIFLIREPTAEEREGVEKLETNKSVLAKSKGTEQYNVKPRDVVKTFNFWKIYTLYFTYTMVNVFMNSYTKAFGQQFIQDDQFFSLIGTLQNVFNGSSRIIWGGIYDKMGFQFCMVVIGSVGTAIAFSFSCLSLVEPNSVEAKIFYGVWVCGLFAFLSGQFSCYPPATNAAFGPKYCSINYGLAITSGVVYSLLLVLVTEFLFDYIGYVGMFLICGVTGVVGVIAALSYPRTISSEMYRSRFETAEKEEGDDVKKD